jgi:hypothetical protein
MLHLETRGVPAWSRLPYTEIAATPSTAAWFAYFEVVDPRPLELRVLTEGPYGACPSLITLAIPLRRPVSAPLHLGAAVFEGHPETARLLNADKALVKSANALVVARTTIGDRTLRIDRHLEIQPIDGKDESLLLVRTLPKPRPRSVSYRIPEALEVAAAIETHL